MSVGQRVLRDGEERVRLRVRLAQCGDESAPGVGTAEINAAGRNGVDDPLTEGHRILGVALGECVDGQFHLDHGLPDRRAHGRIIPRSFILAGAFLQALEGVGDDGGGSGLRRAKVGPHIIGDFQIQLLRQHVRLGFLDFDEAHNLRRQAGLGRRSGLARTFQRDQEQSNDDG